MIADELWERVTADCFISMEGLAEISHDDFLAAIAEAMKRQREMCAKVFKEMLVYAYDMYGLKPDEFNIEVFYQAILNATEDEWQRLKESEGKS